jgi:hypothetical protein
MYTHHYVGFHRQPSQCNVCFGQINGQPAIVFHQTKLTVTSITNVIEDLSTYAMNAHFKGVDPKTIIVIEHYDPHLNPIAEWQRVTFEVAELVDDRGFVEKVLDTTLAFARKPRAKRTVVAKPQWSPVTPQMQALAAQVP